MGVCWLVCGCLCVLGMVVALACQPALLLLPGTAGV